MQRQVLFAIAFCLTLCVVAGAAAERANARHQAPYFVGNFDTCDFSQWHKQGPENAFAIIQSPRIEGRCAAAITIGPWALNGMVQPQADGAAYFLQPDAYGQVDHRVWQHFSIRFAPGFQAAPGEWNFFAQWHNDNGWQKFAAQLPQRFEFSNLCWMVRNRNGESRIIMRIVGGPSTSPRWLRVIGPRLRTGRWYDFLVRATWSPDPHVGKVQWWLDGKRMFSKHVATLFTRPDGSVSSVYFIEDHYRRHITATTTIFFDGTRLGPSRSSVSYSRR